jgi:hypothetical protein
VVEAPEGPLADEVGFAEQTEPEDKVKDDVELDQVHRRPLEADNLADQAEAKALLTAEGGQGGDEDEGNATPDELLAQPEQRGQVIDCPEIILVQLLPEPILFLDDLARLNPQGVEQLDGAKDG